MPRYTGIDENGPNLAVPFWSAQLDQLAKEREQQMVDYTALDSLLYPRYRMELTAPQRKEPEKPKAWLDQAKEMTTQDRRKHYGHPLPNFIRIAIGWIVTFDKVLTPLQVAQGMVTLKMARDVNMYKDDDWIDTIGYSNTVQMMNERMKEMGYSTGIEYFSQFKDGALASKLYEVLARHEREYLKGK